MCFYNVQYIFEFCGDLWYVYLISSNMIMPVLHITYCHMNLSDETCAGENVSSEIVKNSSQIQFNIWFCYFQEYSFRSTKLLSFFTNIWKIDYFFTSWLALVNLLRVRSRSHETRHEIRPAQDKKIVPIYSHFLAPIYIKMWYEIQVNLDFNSVDLTGVRPKYDLKLLCKQGG